MAIKLGIDFGQSSVKIVGAAGSVQFLSQVALIGDMSVDVPALGRRLKRPMVVENGSGPLFVGPKAHKWGTPIENINYERLAEATSGMKAIFHGALSEYQRQFGRFEEPLEVIVGLPMMMMTGENKDKYERQVKAWVGGDHHWKANDVEYGATITRVNLLPQAMGAVVDYAFDESGNAVSAENNKALTQECATIWIGSSTVELAVTKRDEDTKRFNGSSAIGVKWLHNQVDPTGAWKFGEFDEMLRANDLPDGMDIDKYKEAWDSEITGFISSRWRQGGADATKRFYRIFIGGGGSLLLREQMISHFNGKVVFPKDPIMSIANGLYKAALRSR